MCQAPREQQGKKVPETRQVTAIDGLEDERVYFMKTFSLFFVSGEVWKIPRHGQSAPGVLDK